MLVWLQPVKMMVWSFRNKQIQEQTGCFPIAALHLLLFLSCDSHYLSVYPSTCLPGHLLWCTFGHLQDNLKLPTFIFSIIHLPKCILSPMQLHILSADGSYHFFSPVRSCAFFGHVLTIKYANCSILGCHKATIVYSLSSYHTYNWPKFWNSPHALRLICPQAWILRSYAPLQLTD